MKWTAVIFAAGKGTRMKHLTTHVAKPSLSVGSETLISRLIRQVSSTSRVSEIFVNCSYKSESIINAVCESAHSQSVKVLWEYEPQGTSRSLLTIAPLISGAILAVHGDLFLGDGWLDNIYSNIGTAADYSYVAIHRRQRRLARSEVILDGNLVCSISSANLRESKSLEEEVWSNSGIYLIQSEHLDGIDFGGVGQSEVVEGVLQPLIESRRLKALPFAGYRFSIESPEDLFNLRTSIVIP